MSFPEHPRRDPENDEAWAIRPARPEELAVAMAIDDDASELFAAAGLSMAHLHPEHPFVLGEHRRWAAAARRGSLYLACEESGRPVGFTSLGTVDGDCHLDQLAVLRAWMRRGIGRALVAHALEGSKGHGALWLTTYAHVPWNRPYYERLGFSVVPEPLCGPEIRAILAEERAALPRPEQRVAMRATR